MSRFFNNFSLGAQFRRRDPEGKKDIEKGPDVLTEEHEHGSSQDELDDTELDLEEENEEDEVIEDHDEDHDEVMEDHDEELEHHEELEQEDTTNNKSFHRRRSSTGLSLFSAASIDFHYRPRSPPKWILQLKSFLYPPGPLRDGDDSDSVSSFVPNYRYTPIFSAILIPFSILLEIPGLTTNWYIRTINNETVEKRPNPVILDVGLAISFACALAASIALVTRFLERNVKLMTVLCVMFLTLHDIINIVAVTTFGIEHRFDDGFTYGQSFWMTLCSTIASTVTNATLIIDFVRTPDFASSGSGLTRKQRSLVIIVIILLVYIAFGALIESVILKLNFIDALYFTICSIEAIGFGDILPTTPGSKVFVCFYSIFGIINLVLAVSLTRETVLEALEVGYRKRVHAARTKRKNLRWQKRVAKRWRAAISWRLRERGQPIWVLNQPASSNNASNTWIFKARAFVCQKTLRFVEWSFPQWTWTSKWKGLGGVAHPKGKHLNLEALEGPSLEAAAMEAGVPLSELLPPGFAKRWAERHPSTLEGDATRRGAPFVPGSTFLPFPLSRDNSRNSASQLGASAWAWVSRLQNAQSSYDPNEIPLTHARLGRMMAMLGGFALAVDKSSALRGGVTNRGGLSPRRAEAAPASTLLIPPLLTSTGSSGTASTTIPLSPTSQKRVPKSLSQQYEAYRVAMEKEETKAFYARLVVVWTIFLIFWMFGSGIFMVAEGWSFGIAMYFCVVAFTTIGYGDYSPKTPAGRSIFVGWALLGVATMTILLSVLAEAYTSRYKNILQSTKIFDRAVGKYKAREKAKALERSEEKKKQKTLPPSVLSSPPPPLPIITVTNPDSTEQESSPAHTSPSNAFVPHPHPHLHFRAFSDSQLHNTKVHGLNRTLHHADKKLEELPRRILTHARLFHEHLQYFVGPGSAANGSGRPSKDDKIPQSLKRLMDDIAGASKFGERIQKEILQDSEARQTLFTLSIEKALRKMIEAAEDAIESLEERDRLSVMNDKHEHECAHDDYPGKPNDYQGRYISTEAIQTEPLSTNSDLRFFTNQIEVPPRRENDTRF